MPKSVAATTSVLQESLQNYIQNSITHKDFQKTLTENLQPELETDQDTTNLAHRAILEYFESVLVYANNNAFSAKSTDQFFSTIKNLLTNFKNNSELPASEFKTQELVESEIKNCVEKCEDSKTEIVKFLRTSFFNHLKLWKKFFHESRQVLHVREDKFLMKTVEAKSLKYALPAEYEKLDEVDEGEFNFIRYSELKEEETMGSESLEVDVDPKTEEINKLTSFELKYSKQEIFEMVNGSKSGKFDFSDNLEQFYQDLKGKVENHSREMKQNYE